MRKYETLLLLSPELNAENKKGVIDNLVAIIEREEGTMLSVDDWGTKELAYPVRKFVRGQYVRMEYTSPGKAVAELERIVRITDGIFKFVTVKLADKYVPAAPVEA
ncbi:MAG: 30S ribosomal protein S6 [Desulfovibrio sp.]|jgi:small subunit ribosomal protein S6|nr:30S ribosomal protein S6 [Desulfovibrio sp.]MBI4960217.1 30S ribosomal protein S6 [Desulfovibrio sp.]